MSLIAFEWEDIPRSRKTSHVAGNRITCEKKELIGFQFNHRRFSFSGRNCRESSQRLAVNWHTRIHVTCIRRPHMIMHTLAHRYTQSSTRLALPLSSFFQLLSPERLLPLYSHQRRCYLASVKLYFICKLFFPRVYRSTPRPFARPSYLLSWQTQP